MDHNIKMVCKNVLASITFVVMPCVWTGSSYVTDRDTSNTVNLASTFCIMHYFCVLTPAAITLNVVNDIILSRSD